MEPYSFHKEHLYSILDLDCMFKFLRSEIENLKIKGNLYHLVGRNNMGHLLVSNKQQVL